MEKIGLFYGPKGGSTEKVAKRMAEFIGNDKVDLIPVKDSKAQDLEKYSNVIFGVSTIGKETWNGYSTASDWDKFRPELDKIDYSGKVIAMFSLGDHITYPKHFVDALGQLAEILLPHNANIVGYVNTDDYEFEESTGIYDGKFIGLPVDEDYEPEKTDQRIKKWLDDILPKFK